MYFPRLLDNISGYSTLCDKFALNSLTPRMSTSFVVSKYTKGITLLYFLLKKISQVKPNVYIFKTIQQILFSTLTTSSYC